MRIRDLGWKEFGSGMEKIRIRDPGLTSRILNTAYTSLFSDLAVWRGASPALSPGDPVHDASRDRLRLHTSGGRQPLPHQVCPWLSQGHQVRVQAEKPHPNSLITSIGDPDPQDPHVFGPPGPGSGYFYHQANKQNLDSYCFMTSFWLFIFEKCC